MLVFQWVRRKQQIKQYSIEIEAIGNSKLNVCDIQFKEQCMGEATLVDLFVFVFGLWKWEGKEREVEQQKTSLNWTKEIRLNF